MSLKRQCLGEYRGWKEIEKKISLWINLFAGLGRSCCIIGVLSFLDFSKEWRSFQGPIVNIALEECQAVAAAIFLVLQLLACYCCLAGTMPSSDPWGQGWVDPWLSWWLWASGLWPCPLPSHNCCISKPCRKMMEGWSALLSGQMGKWTKARLNLGKCIFLLSFWSNTPSLQLPYNHIIWGVSKTLKVVEFPRNRKKGHQRSNLTPKGRPSIQLLFPFINWIFRFLDELTGYCLAFPFYLMENIKITAVR